MYEDYTGTPCVDNFKKKFKYYKLTDPTVSSKEVLSVDNNLRRMVRFPLFQVKKINNEGQFSLLGLHKPYDWQIYTFTDHPGLIFIRNPFTSIGQRYWIRKCLEEYPRKPNKSNIDIEIFIKDWWSECYSEGHCNKQLLKKLRWTTLGYHHNWDTKIYSEENKNEFPQDLAELSQLFAQCLGYHNFKAEAAIVNYYHMNSTLSAHTDHSEVNVNAPLFSFSFGQSAIFLIGGRDRSIEPSAILLNSGDVLVMSEEARLCYHAVPKILPATTKPRNVLEKVNFENTEVPSSLNQETLKLEMTRNIDNKEWTRFNDYVNESRININVRQVLNENQCCL